MVMGALDGSHWWQLHSMVESSLPLQASVPDGRLLSMAFASNHDSQQKNNLWYKTYEGRGEVRICRGYRLYALTAGLPVLESDLRQLHKNLPKNI